MAHPTEKLIIEMDSPIADHETPREIEDEAGRYGPDETARLKHEFGIEVRRTFDDAPSYANRSDTHDTPPKKFDGDIEVDDKGYAVHPVPHPRTGEMRHPRVVNGRYFWS